MNRVDIQSVIDILRKLSQEQVTAVYEFALFLRARQEQINDVSDHDICDKWADTDDLHSANPAEPTKLSDYAGVGKELWRAIDVDHYLQEERDAWAR